MTAQELMKHKFPWEIAPGISMPDAPKSCDNKKES
jgi:hypothetical protein